MLIELAVRNLGVVEELHLVFDSGMTALTGETGAGKTMIVEALELLSGGRADPGVIRDGATEATIEGRFVRGDEETVIRRVVPVAGRSRAYVDGHLATIATLAETMAEFVELYAQHGQQSLTGVAGQRKALDRFAGVDLAPLSEAKAALRAIETELEALGGDPAVREREIGLLQFQLAELDDAALDDPDEDERLATIQLGLGDVAAHRERGLGALEGLVGERGAQEALGAVLDALGDDDVFASPRRRLQGVIAELADVATELRVEVEGIVEDPERLTSVTERRQVLASLRRRYGRGTLEGVIEEHRRLSERLAALLQAEGRIGELIVEIERAQHAVATASARIGMQRRGAAERFATETQRELRELAMPAAVFEVVVPDDDPADAVEMRISANPGMAPAALGRIASGGELARVMLALRLVAAADQGTVVFDEVDAGIGGAAAVAVGSALARVARNRQVLVVTHLAQVAAAAGTQIGVVKTVIDGSTTMRAEVLEGDDRVVELSRMMSGHPSSDVAHAHARELLEASGIASGDE